MGKVKNDPYFAEKSGKISSPWWLSAESGWIGDLKSFSNCPSCYCVLLMRPTRFKFIKITPRCCKGPKIMHFTSLHKFKSPRPRLKPLLLATETFILPLSVG
jgi:hypothetical protein